MNMRTRVCVVGLVKNHKGDCLICKKPEGLGVYAGKWAIPGGGIDENETANQAFEREMREEIGIKVEKVKPLGFSDDTAIKLFADGRKEELYMIYLYFECLAEDEKIELNQEFEDYAWINEKTYRDYEIGEYTMGTLRQYGVIPNES